MGGKYTECTGDRESRKKDGKICSAAFVLYKVIVSEKYSRGLEKCFIELLIVDFYD